MMDSSVNYHRRNEKSGRKWITVAIWSGVIFAVLAYSLHVPLPHSLGDRHVLQVIELVLRVVYFYPMRFLAFMGAEWQLIWTRLSMVTLAKVVTNPWTSYDRDLNIYDTQFAGVPVRIYQPKIPNPNNTAGVVFVHGGGFVLFDVNGYDTVAREISRQSQMITVSIDYRLAPEAPFPAGLNDVRSASTHFLDVVAKELGLDPERIAIVGDSAGGNLAAATVQWMKRSGRKTNFKVQALLYPLLQFIDFQTPSYQMYHKLYSRSALLDPESMMKYSIYLYLGIEPGRIEQMLVNNHTSLEVFQYASKLMRHEVLPDSYRKPHFYEGPKTTQRKLEVMEEFAELQAHLLNPDFSPLMAPDLDLLGLPKSYVATAEIDILRDEGYWYAERLMNAGVNTTYVHYEKGFHAMLNFHGEIAVGQQCIVDLAAFLSRNL